MGCVVCCFLKEFSSNQRNFQSCGLCCLLLFNSSQRNFQAIIYCPVVFLNAIFCLAIFSSDPFNFSSSKTNGIDRLRPEGFSAHWSPSMRLTETVLETYTNGMKGGTESLRVWPLTTPPPPHLHPSPTPLSSATSLHPPPNHHPCCPVHHKSWPSSANPPPPTVAPINTQCNPHLCAHLTSHQLS